MGNSHITQHICYGLTSLPSGHCSLRSQRRICWERFDHKTSCAKITNLDYEALHNFVVQKVTGNS
ncbi:MAG: hypothetical protein DNFNHJIP_00611 [Candidatus Argoarchaeum ethanivorans]|uniref:Uncharacterized protein n=1 Tax=Candidatus Argoarchaeum ethanivorans TaxID=2608793 RepID=A0A812A215_9EURY|nr:MAG: hypothetical protein DNFNHJIP_00611 [Candidatus Argoarchaeum ethanivorans]